MAATILEERPAMRVEKARLVQQERTIKNQEEEEKIQYEIIFPVGDAIVSDHDFDFVIQTARKFSSAVTLVYVCKSTEVPEGFVEYARCEGIRDYEMSYYTSLAREKLAPLQKKALEAKVKCQSTVFVGRMKDVFKSYSTNSPVVLSGSSGKSVLIQQSILH